MLSQNTKQNMNLKFHQKKNTDKTQQSSTRQVGEYKGNANATANWEIKQSVEQILGKARPSIVVDIIEKGDEMTEEDLEILEAVQQNLEDEQKEQVAEEEVDALECSLTRCYITGCEVHTLTPQLVHYGNCSCGGGSIQSIGSMSPRMKKGYEYYKKYPDCSYVEVYQRHICVVGCNGTSKVFNE